MYARCAVYLVSEKLANCLNKFIVVSNTIQYSNVGECCFSYQIKFTIILCHVQNQFSFCV